jgi:hypothetical protein
LVPTEGEVELQARVLNSTCAGTENKNKYRYHFLINVLLGNKRL